MNILLVTFAITQLFCTVYLCNYPSWNLFENNHQKFCTFLGARNRSSLHYFNNKYAVLYANSI